METKKVNPSNPYLSILTLTVLPSTYDLSCQVHSTTELKQLWIQHSTFDLIFYHIAPSSHTLISLKALHIKNLTPTRKIYLYNIALSLQLWQDVIKSEIINTFIGVFILRDKFSVVGQLIGCSDCPDGRSKLISWRGVILSSANINYDSEWLKLQHMWVKAGYMSSLGGGLRNDQWEVEGDELSKLKEEYIRQAKG